jgi:hypothetical protein
MGQLNLISALLTTLFTMKKPYFLLSKLAFLLTLLISQSCQSINSYKISKARKGAIVFHYDGKSIFLKAPAKYCFYNQKNPAELDVINLVQNVTDLGKEATSEVKLLLQKCDEKRDFLNTQNSNFRNIATIEFALTSHLQNLKNLGIDNHRETYTKFFHKNSQKQNLQSVNKFIADSLPKMRAHNLKTLDESQNLTAEQKSELKMVYNHVLGNKSEKILSYKNKLEWGVAAYEYQAFSVGEVFTKCVIANTLINYIPLTIKICEEGKLTDSWMDLERRINEYVWMLIKINDDR